MIVEWTTHTGSYITDHLSNNITFDKYNWLYINATIDITSNLASLLTKTDSIISGGIVDHAGRLLCNNNGEGIYYYNPIRIEYTTDNNISLLNYRISESNINITYLIDANIELHKLLNSDIINVISLAGELNRFRAIEIVIDTHQNIDSILLDYRLLETNIQNLFKLKGILKKKVSVADMIIIKYQEI